jgi:hypothetical protein
MAGKFELFLDREANFRFRLRAPDGTVMAESAAFSDKSARHDWHKRADGFHTRAKTIRRAALAPRWTGAA